jgi:hypothetical protein
MIWKASAWKTEQETDLTEIGSVDSIHSGLCPMMKPGITCVKRSGSSVGEQVT